MAERWEDEVCTLIRNEMNELRRLGRFVHYDFNTSSSYMIQGAAYVAENDADDVRLEKERLMGVDEYFEAISALSPQRFEALCAGILYELGVPAPTLTPYAGDEGIDFYGRMALDRLLAPEALYPGVESQFSVWMIGQAKHYQKSAVSTFHIRELVGSVELAKRGAFSLREQGYLQPPVRSCDAVFYLFFTTGQMTSQSWRLIEESGVIGMDGAMIAAFISRRSSTEGTVAERLSLWLAPFIAAIGS
jgi:restriction endonuclease Mrr